MYHCGVSLVFLSLIIRNVGPTWAPVGLATRPQLGSLTGPLQILSLTVPSRAHYFGLAQNGPHMGPNWAPAWFRMGSVWANSWVQIGPQMGYN